MVPDFGLLNCLELNTYSSGIVFRVMLSMNLFFPYAFERLLLLALLIFTDSFGAGDDILIDSILEMVAID